MCEHKHHQSFGILTATGLGLAIWAILFALAYYAWNQPMPYSAYTKKISDCGRQQMFTDIRRNSDGEITGINCRRVVE